MTKQTGLDYLLPFIKGLPEDGELISVGVRELHLLVRAIELRDTVVEALLIVGRLTDHFEHTTQDTLDRTMAAFMLNDAQRQLGAALAALTEEGE